MRRLILVVEMAMDLQGECPQMEIAEIDGFELEANVGDHGELIIEQALYATKKDAVTGEVEYAHRAAAKEHTVIVAPSEWTSLSWKSERVPDLEVVG